MELFNAQPKAPALHEKAGAFGWALNDRRGYGFVATMLAYFIAPLR